MYIIKLLIKNSFRHKLRTFLTILSVAIAILAFGLLRTVIDAWYAGVSASSVSRIVTRHAVSIILSLPISYKEKIRQIEGVKTVSYGTWFGGYYIDEKNFFANFAVEPISFLAIYPGNWEFVLRGIYKGRDKNSDESQFFFHFDYLNETLKKTAPARADQVGYYIMEVTNSDFVADVARRIDKTFYNSLAETLTETEKAFQLGFVSMSDAIIVIILAVVANTINMTARERISEYAVFKTLGFRGWRIAGLIFGESLIITLMGCTMGIILTFPSARAFEKTVGNYFPVFNVSIDTIVMDVVFSLFVGLLAAAIPTLNSIRISIAEGLRRVF
jgi:putative ABC transport system permease protein